MSSDAMSEQSSICDGASYDEVFGLGHESEGFSGSSEKETSAQSPDNDVKSYVEGNEKEVVDEDEGEEGSDGDEDEGDEESYEGTSGGPRENRPFILPANWSVISRSQTISHSVYQRKMKDAIQGGLQMSAYTTPCSLRD